MKIHPLANRLWELSNHGRFRAFRRAVDDPGTSQRRALQGILRAAEGSWFGRRRGFAGIRSVAELQARVPLSTWEDYAGAIARIRAGEPGVLTAEPVLRLQPTSGSTAAAKLIPYTRRLQAELNHAVGPWVVDLFHRHPRLRAGRAYWSISPAMATPGDESPELGPPAGRSRVPIGFADDSEYLGGLARRLVEPTLAVPVALSRIASAEAWRYLTLAFLLSAEDLRLISVWHPSFLGLLLDALPRFWDRLLDDLEDGTLEPPADLDGPLAARLAREWKPLPRRAEALAARGPEDLAGLWPSLTVISCWADAHAAAPAAELAERFPGIEIQAKGLLATEAVITIPFAGRRPLAVASHFFELLDEKDRPHLAEEARAGGEYTLAVTTGGGLYRYRIPDRVRVDGFLGRTPCLSFLGRSDAVSDLAGEKLADGFVAAVLSRLLAPLAGEVAFALLAPEASSPPCYTLFLEARRAPGADLASRLDRELGTNPCYAGCRRLGQLGPPRLFRIEAGGHRVYLDRQRLAGRRLGDVKPAALAREAGWSEWFEGGYVDGPRQARQGPA